MVGGSPLLVLCSTREGAIRQKREVAAGSAKNLLPPARLWPQQPSILASSLGRGLSVVVVVLLRGEEEEEEDEGVDYADLARG